MMSQVILNCKNHPLLIPKKDLVIYQQVIFSQNDLVPTSQFYHGTCCSPCLAVCRSKTMASRVSRATRLTSRPALALIDCQDLDTWILGTRVTRYKSMCLKFDLEICSVNSITNFIFLHFTNNFFPSITRTKCDGEIGSQDTISESHRPKPPLLGLLDPSCASSVGVREKDITVPKRKEWWTGSHVLA